MTMNFTKPLPIPTPTTAPFWEGLRAGVVRLQRCEACGAWVFYPRVRCPRCLSERLAWQRVSGHGTLVTYTIARQPTAPHFADEVPQKLAVVELDEGVRLTTTLVADEAEIRIGMPVVPVFDPVSDEITLLRYRPA
jgi:uncharacterized OB-fold protein